MKLRNSPHIYLSSACSVERDIILAVKNLRLEGFKKIELTGGTDHSEKCLDDLKKLGNDSGLMFSIHNYFPAPRTHFALNIADPSSINQKNIDLHLQSVGEAVRMFDLNFYSIHAGILIAPDHREFGGKLTPMSLIEKETSIQCIRQNIEKIQKLTGLQPSQIYIENNVFSQSNRKSFPNENPFIFCFFEDFSEIFESLGVRPLLDLAHLKVSCKTLGRQFQEEVKKFVGKTDYVHISDNDGVTDQNLGVRLNSEIFEALKLFREDLDKVTIEVYSGIDQIKMTYANLKLILDEQNDFYPRS